MPLEGRKGLRAPPLKRTEIDEEDTQFIIKEMRAPLFKKNKN